MKIKMMPLLFLSLLLVLPAFAAADKDADAIAEIGDEKPGKTALPQGAPDTLTATVKKGEGFDFKVPEILITGQIDTRILLTREIKSLENLQDVKNMIYEKERMNLPYSYLKEEDLAPQKLEMPREKDLAAKIRLWAGTLSALGAEALLGKSFDRNQSALIAVSHENSGNAVINDRQTYSNSNNARLHYATVYGGARALYAVEFDSYQYINPYPQDVFGRHAISERVRAGLNLDGEINRFGYGLFANYAYFGRRAGDGAYVLKENRVSAKLDVERDVSVEGMKKAKIVMETDGYYSDFDALTGGGVSSLFSFDALLRGIMFFEPLILQGGARVQTYRSADFHLRVSPYLSAYYDIMPTASVYAEFAPMMKAYDFMADRRLPFIRANGPVRPSVDNIDFRFGAAFELPFMFTDVYYRIKSVNASAVLEPAAGSTVSAPGNYDIDYNSAGIKLETKVLSGFKAKVKYEYRAPSVDGQLLPPDYTWNMLEASVSYEKAEWAFGIAGAGTSANAHNPAYFGVDGTLSRKITENMTVFGYVNNILNTEYYMLYYYEEKPLNLGLGMTLNF